ncbi:MAG TPA: YggS family pyridoxal phosphate-dependent enzyme [Candidatus Omnitrophota bacterium]|nr:YggS family pyridoxal phosphate-dependent enzyme [Candidatus Omnitrophota bacterium]
MIRNNLAQIREQICDICQRVGRNPDEVTLVGVTKYADSALVQQAVEAGLKHIGENKVQDARLKFARLQEVGLKVTKHMIGHLQTNKAKDAVAIFDMIQSVDSLKLAAEVQRQAQNANKTMDVLIQVNTSGEQQKFGIRPDEAAALIQQMQDMTCLRVKGLMTIAPLTQDQNMIRRSFRDLKILKDAIVKQLPQSERVDMRYLSMGMSDDFAIALEEGSNMIRIGRAIFK